MLTEDKTITTPEYWDSLYKGERKDAPVDSSNGVRLPSAFDRFDIVVKAIEKGRVLDIGSGHARIAQKLKAMWPQELIVASDQSTAARDISKFYPYAIFSAYEIPYEDKSFDTIICSQALEYMEFQDKAISEFRRVAKKLICTIPIGEMARWSQLYIYNENDFCKWLNNYGTIEVKENYGDILLIKLKFL